MKKHKCSNCHKNITTDQKFCEYCGYEVKEDQKIQNKGKQTPIFFIVIGVLLLLCGGLSSYILFVPKDITQNVIKQEKEVTINENGIADAVLKVYDAVVVIESYQNENLYATGTGFVFKVEKGKGYILTNNHVIENADSVEVMFSNDKSIQADLVGTDKYSDIAVLSVDSSNVIQVAEIGSSEQLRVGDTTFTVGAPLDYEVYSWSVTRGILSGKDRLVEVSLSNSYTSDYIMEVLQTDAAINSGNSGGPLCNSNGQVIGITNMKLANSSIEGMGFAIPIETAIDYANKFINGETIVRPYMGVSMHDVGSLSGMYKYYLNSNITSGVYISSVEQNSPASQAGLQQGDVITKINGEEVSNSAHLRYKLFKNNVGDTIEITYLRKGKEATTKLTLKASNPSL